MYGASSKLGGRGGARGGGAGGTKRLSSFPPPPPHRSSTASNHRLSLGGNSNHRNRSAPTAAMSSATVAVEETFSLIPGDNPLAFSMIIRLAPDMVDEIRRVEAQGGTARIKFDSLGSNTNGNVINVGGKEFRFTWSREFGDLCDIYEERQSGEDGNGLLVESGCAWRKVNVQRILDESTKNHVKMRSEEADRKHKSRKAIVLDHGNPSMKSQIKQLAAAEANPWRMPFKKKELPFKKQKVEPPLVPKSTFKPGVSSTTSAKGRHSSSPLPSTPEQSGTPASPFVTGNVAKVNTEEVTPTQSKSKENATNTEKEFQTKASSAAWETTGHEGNFGTKPMDLQSMLITLLSGNPKGMSLKALEKAIGDKIPNSAKKIEPIIKRIATFQAPGRYFLKSGVELESFRKPSYESGSSPEDNCQQALVPEDNHNHRPPPESRFVEKSPAVGFEEHAQSNSKFEEESTIEKIDIQQHSPDLFGEKKASDNSEGQAGSSSDSGSDSDSDSDSDSSDSGSDSGSCSRSRSRSPVGSGSGSSSDSESDASSNSKEGSDEDVDIISDDDKEPQHKLHASEPTFLVSPVQWRSEQNGTGEKQDGDGSDAVDIDGPGSAAHDVEGHESDAVDIEKDLADNEKEVELAANDSLVPSKEGNKVVEGYKFSFSDHDAIQERKTFIGTLFDDNENMVRDSFRHEQSDSSELKSKSKRGPDIKHFDEKSEHAKRLKIESLAQAPISEVRDAQLSESPHNRDIEETYRGAAVQTINRIDREGNTDFGSQKAYNQAFAGKPSSDFQQLGQRSSEKNARSKASDTRRSKHSESSGHGRKFSEKSSHVHEGYPIQREKASRDAQNEDNFTKEKKAPRNPKEGGAGGRHSAPFDSHHRKQGETFGKFKEATQITNSHMGSSPKDGNRVDMEKFPAVSERTLQRELSELELGEFRESLLEETPVKKQFGRKSSFKQSENKQSTSDNCNSDLSKTKPVVKTALDSGKPSPPNLGSGFKESPDHPIEDLMRSNHKFPQSHPQHLSRVDNSEVSHFGKLADTNSRLRQNEAVAKLGNSMEGYGESHKGAPANAQQLHDSKRGQLSHLIKESKTQTSNVMADFVEGQKDPILTEVNNNAQKRRESSSEEDTTSYSKYEKDEPELRRPIKDFLQYKEYVQEYRDKYDCYCSLNKSLEKYRNDFQKMGRDLEFAKGRDMDRYHKILLQLRESYRHCGARHKRLRKIFIVLHEELKNLKQRIKEFALLYTKD
ncbi:hypothetical protein P3X46_001517 [Hevea brasiliensis]|uniref:OCEL domain-containing protein n=1 Tax=Hevea brasiliensis TaxID=3981 RepID=A0ABQ9NIF2_HEVBR|nr:hypothetical protein P3X46_001517 [Hevea brasiliensis]